MRKVLIVAGLAALFSATVASAQGTHLLIADSSSSGTYKAMLAEVRDVCGTDDFTIDELPQQGGAPENLEALKNNRASAAFLHSDVIYAAAQADPSYKELKTLVALYPEEIHVLALRNSITKQLSMGAFKPYQQFNSLGDLAGFNVGAAGGGVITARVLTGQGEGHFNVIPYNTGKEVIDALGKGEISAAIFVGGSPLPNLTGLSADQYKLLPIGETIASRVSGVYRPATINYTNLRSGVVKTLAPQALLVTRKYTRPQMIEPQAHLRECFMQHLDDLKETPGKHPKWQLVDPQDHGVWDWYELPTTTAVIKPAIKK